MRHEAYCENYYDTETGQWEYAPRYVVVERGRLISQDCAKCGQSIDIGRDGAKCTNCQIEAATTAQISVSRPPRKGSR